jgi:dihydrolipoamide dehydrogenase
MTKNVDIAILGSGSAGLYALGSASKKTKNFVLINGGELGTTCARVGCMPSKAIIQMAEDFNRRHILKRYGITGQNNLNIDLAESMEHVRDLRDIFVERVMGKSTDKLPKDKFIQGYAKFVEPNVLEVNGEAIHFESVVIATGSRPFVPKVWQKFGDKVITTNEFFELEQLPESMAIIGLGAIGLELGQALNNLGIKVVGIDKLTNIAGLKDTEVNKTAINIISKEFPLWLGSEAEITAKGDKLKVTAGENSVIVDKVLASLGRVPNLENLDLDKLGITCDARGIPEYNRNTMQVVDDATVFIAGDANGEKAMLHEAGFEGRVAGLNATSNEILAFKRKTSIAITFCEPNITTVGSSLDELDTDSIAIGEVNFAPVGRALIMGKNKGLLRVYGDKQTGKILGASMIAPKGENLAHLLCWAIEQDLTVIDLLRMPYYHPVIEEALQAALYDLLAKTNIETQLPIELELLK